MRRDLFGVGLAAGAGLTALLGYARYIEPQWFQVKRVQLRLPRLDRAFDGYRIAQISDVHFDDWITVDQLARAVALVNRQKPDLIVFTGDFVSNGRLRPENAAALTETLKALTAPDGVVAIFGNHDYYAKRRAIPQLETIMRDSHMRSLNNAVMTLKRKGATLHIAGVDDLIAAEMRLDLVLDALPEEGAAVLLAHEPDIADFSAATGRFDVQLSGHTHDGQVNIAFLRRLVLPMYGRRYVAGLHRVKEMQLYVNRGLGTVSIPFRLNARPEITLITLRHTR
ncbi:MAG: metallophosphoesterase [Anaerolineae bacterium]